MVKLYVSLYSRALEKESIKGKTKVSLFLRRLMYSFKNIFRNYNVSFFENSISIKVNEDYLNKICIRQNRKYSFEENKLLKFLCKKVASISSSATVKVLFSNEILNMMNIKKYIQKLLMSQNKLNFEFIERENELLLHDINIIERYLMAKKVKNENAKLLVICKNILSYNHEKMKEYIERYKQVDLLLPAKVKGYVLTNIKNKIEELNREYGSTISLIKNNKKDISYYDVYILYGYQKEEEIVSKYVVNKKSKWINMEREDEDYLSSNYKVFVMKEKEIKDSLHQLKLNIQSFSIIALGKLFK